jgi:hypothetical protein
MGPMGKTGKDDKKNNHSSGYHSAEQPAVIPGYCICNNEIRYRSMFPGALPHQKTGGWRLWSNDHILKLDV